MTTTPLLSFPAPTPLLSFPAPLVCYATQMAGRIKSLLGADHKIYALVSEYDQLADVYRDLLYTPGVVFTVYDSLTEDEKISRVDAFRSQAGPSVLLATVQEMIA